MQVTILGTGLMGAASGRRLLEQGHQLTVWNRTRSKAASLGARGANVAETPAGAVEASEVVILLLSDAGAIDSVLFETEAGNKLNGRTLLQMGTISPTQSQRLAERVNSSGGTYLEAPVLGSTPQAEQGELWVMVGGERTDYERLLPLLSELGRDPIYVGDVGKAAALKLALNQLLVAMVTSFSLSLGMVLRADVPVEIFMQILRESALHAEQYDKKLPRMLQRDFSDPHFPVAHMLKDVDLIQDTARRMGLGAEMQAGVREIIERALDMGYVDVDYSALYNAVNPES